MLLEKEYRKKAAEITPVKEFNRRLDLAGWQFAEIKSSALKQVYEYYEYPAQKKDTPVFLLLHGMNLDGKTFLELSPLTAAFRLLALNFPERSDYYQGSMQDCVLLIQDFCRTMNLKEIYLAGVSYGGIAAMSFTAADTGIKVKALALLATFTSGALEDEIPRNIIYNTFIKNTEDYKILWMMEKFYHLAGNGKNSKSIGRILKIKHPAFYRQVFASLENLNAGEKLKAVYCPAVQIHGINDKTVPYKRAQQSLEIKPQMPFYTIARAGHDVVSTHGNEIAEILLDFCSNLPYSSKKK